MKKPNKPFKLFDFSFLKKTKISENVLSFVKSNALTLGAFVAILIVAVFCLTRLVNWSHKTVNVDTPSEDDLTFATEYVDYHSFIADENRALAEDDGVNTIVLFGNNYLTRNAEKSGVTLERLIKDKLPEANVISLAVETSYVSAQCGSDVHDIFSLPSLINALTTNNFESIEYVLPYMFSNDTERQNFMDNITSIDIGSVDTVVFAYSSLDYSAGLPIDDPENPSAPTTYLGGYSAAIMELQQNAPWITIMVASPFQAYTLDLEANDWTPSSAYTYGYGNLARYYNTCSSVTMHLGASFIDNYYYFTNESNLDTYVKCYDLTERGVLLYGNHIVNFIKNHFK